MSKTVSPEFEAHIEGETTSVATAALVTRRDGVIIALTSHIEDVEIDDVVYKARTGTTPSSVSSTADMAVDNLDVVVLLDGEEITEEDLIAGLFDFATVEIFEFNYADLAQGEMTIRTGTIGETSLGDQAVQAELRA